jgi:dienelactone hydrolase
MMMSQLAMPGADLPPDRRNKETPNTDTVFQAKSYGSLEEWQRRRVALLGQVQSALGLYPLPEHRAKPQAKLFGKIDKKSYTIEKVLLETMPGYWLGGNLYRPTTPGKHAAVLHPHGHWSYGRLENEALCSSPTLAANLARHGFVVFMWDMVGYNDTTQTPHEFGTTPAERLYSFSALGVQILNAIRAVDFVSELDDVDAHKVAMTGASGGGTQTFLTAALDQRIQVAAPVNMISLIMQGGCVCENAACLRYKTNNVEIASMIAPRPMLMVSATGDWTKNTLEKEYPAVKSVYELFTGAVPVEAVRFDAPHNYHQDSRQAVYNFLMKHLQPQAQAFKEESITAERLETMLALHNNTRPAGALNFEQLFEQWKQQAKKDAASADVLELKKRLQYVLLPDWPDKVEADNAKNLLTRTGEGDRVPFFYRRGKGDPVLMLHPGGIDEARKSAKFAQLMKTARPLMVIDAFQTGSAVEERDRSHKHFLAFNRTDDAERVQDVLTALRYLTNMPKPPLVQLEAEGDAKLWALFAAAVSPVKVKFDAAPADVQMDDDKLAEKFLVPGLLKAGGVEGALKVLAGDK